MLVQSADGAIHLLPALPDAWMDSGSVSGLKTRGGFEIASLEWKDGKITKLIVRSSLGGIMRLRVPNKLIGNKMMSPASGENTNLFFAVSQPLPPLVNPEAVITKPIFPESFLYDLPTVKGGVYLFRARPGNTPIK